MTEPRPSESVQQKEQLERLKEVQLRQLQFRRRSLGEGHVGTVESMESLSETLVALGEHDRARTLQERCLAVRAEVGGPRDPATTSSAWNLFHTLNRLDDKPAMQRIFEQHLAWLLTAPPDGMAENVRMIREWVQHLSLQRHPGGDGR